MGVMRSSLWPGLLNTYIGNLNNGEENQKIFELGSIFKQDKKGGVREIKQVGGLIAGSDVTPQWNQNPKILDFFDLKGDLQAIFKNLRIDASFEETSSPFLHPGKSSQIRSKNKLIGWMGVIHPDVINHKGLKNEVLVFALNLEALKEKSKIQYKNFSRYPISQRDLAFVVENRISNTQILKLIKAKAGQELVEIRTFDVYQGENVPKGKKSVAFNLKWQSRSKTLIDEDVDEVVKKIVNSLSKEIKAELRS